MLDVRCEGRAAARATVRVESGVGREKAIETAIQHAWVWFRRDMDSDVPFSAVVAFVRARCPGVNPECIRAGFDRRFARRSTSTSSAV